MKKQIIFFVFEFLSVVSVNAQINIDIDPSQKGIEISKMLNGLFFEDINHAADGGLYAELIRNRSFEDNDTIAENWRSYDTAGASAKMELISNKMLNDKHKHALEVKFVASPKALSGISNGGYWGINAVQGRTYKLSFWAKGKLKGTLKVALMDQNGVVSYAEAVIDKKISKKWDKYTTTIISNGNDNNARLYILANGCGTVDFDVVSLFPPTFKNRENGCRPDLAQLLYNIHPKFMRFPGGCFVEGQDNSDNAFHWERTIGPIEERPGHINRNWGYRTTDGMGFHEFLQLAEDINAKPLYVVNIGLWHGGMTPIDSIKPWIDECMNALEYANGDVSTKYGKIRAENGHPAPFNIEYLEIGNENNQPDQSIKSQSDHYYERFKKFKEAVLAKYPKMHLIGNVAAWGTDDPKWDNAEAAELLDEHYYRNPAWFTNNFNKYDFYSRGGSKIYCGEYAVTQGFGRVGNLNAALGEAVYMMGMENNSDVVEMNSYAPIFVNENNVAWQPDMIRYNSSKVMCTPSYYVQKLMASNIGTRIVNIIKSNPYKNVEVLEPKPQSYQVGVGTWGTQSSFDNLKVESSQTQFSDACDNTSDFKSVNGEWKSDNGVLIQKSNKESCVEILDRQISGSKYTYTLRARKDAGNEGFLVLFNYQDPQNYCWFNLGGWGNTLNGLEQIVNGGKSQVATVPGNIEKGRWYDIKIEVDGDSAKCYIDKNNILNAKLRKNTSPGVFSNASIDDNTGEIFVKIVNTSSVNTTAKLNIKNYDIKEARVTRLTSTSGNDENTFDNPTKVYPVEETLSPSKDNVILDVPSYSLNIIRIEK
ncbi:alpha-L-arabinofuranosidase C-terminal domain-containing protein [Xylanibacter oryzae]|uniref:alpha-L-arabinofuranosidase C-terminal domain-containing protein n=1 Tax=Xylanibacter oryzae TaxID=185293 RepID=UPI0004B90FDF|nr:alpha-L-arabinofuranosidase C-terminal domain-containing protein [Xylanibacter oryzae]